MMLVLMLANAIPGLPPIDFDLARAGTAKRRCDPASTSEISVCARQRLDDPNRIGATPDRTDALPKAEIRLFGDVRARLHGEQGSVGGIPSPQVKLSIDIPF